MVIAAGVLAVVCGTVARASEEPKPPTVNETYIGLASDGLTHAKLSDLPKGVLLKAGDLAVTEKEVMDEIAMAPGNVQAELKKQSFFILERIAVRKLILTEAKAEAVKSGKGHAKMAEKELMQGYFAAVADKVKVTDDEVADFYNKNRNLVGDSRLDQVKADLAKYLLQQKQQQAVDKHIEALGQRMSIEVSASWAKEQAILAKDNVVGRARSSGRPSLVDFGSKGCGPCDMMAPILVTLAKKYEGKANVLFVHVPNEQILAARYGIQSIPVQVFFDKDGREVFRHVGFFPQDEIEKKMAEMGVP
jgi:thiol-disulfide isomerase/thioredoxin